MSRKTCAVFATHGGHNLVVHIVNPALVLLDVAIESLYLGTQLVVEALDHIDLLPESGLDVLEFAVVDVHIDTKAVKQIIVACDSVCELFHLGPGLLGIVFTDLE